MPYILRVKKTKDDKEPKMFMYFHSKEGHAMLQRKIDRIEKENREKGLIEDDVKKIWQVYLMVGTNKAPENPEHANISDVVARADGHTTKPRGDIEGALGQLDAELEEGPPPTDIKKFN